MIMLPEMSHIIKIPKDIDKQELEKQAVIFNNLLYIVISSIILYPNY